MEMPVGETPPTIPLYHLDDTYFHSSELLRRYFLDLVKSPANLRLMGKAELQGVAVILNNSLPEHQRIPLWKSTKDELRNAIEELMNFPTYVSRSSVLNHLHSLNEHRSTASPQAPRRSSESGRFDNLQHIFPPSAAVTPVLLASQRKGGPGGTPNKRGTDPFSPVNLDPTLIRRSNSGSRIPLPRNGKMDSLVHPSRSNSYMDFDDQDGSPLASRSMSRISSSNSTPLQSRSNSSSNLAPSTSFAMAMVTPSSSDAAIAAMMRPSKLSASHSREGSGPMHSREGSAGSERGVVHHQDLAESLTVALLGSRSSNKVVPTLSVIPAPTPNHVRQPSVRSNPHPRLSWAGTVASRRMLDILEEDEDEDEGDQTPSRKRRAPEVRLVRRQRKPPFIDTRL